MTKKKAFLLFFIPSLLGVAIVSSSYVEQKWQIRKANSTFKPIVKSIPSVDGDLYYFDDNTNIDKPGWGEHQGSVTRTITKLKEANSIEEANQAIADLSIKFERAGWSQKADSPEVYSHSKNNIPYLQVYAIIKVFESGKSNLIDGYRLDQKLSTHDHLFGEVVYGYVVKLTHVYNSKAPL